MSSTWPLACVLALAGCDRVFGIGDPYEDAGGHVSGSDATRDTGVLDGNTMSVPRMLGHWAFENNLTNSVDGGQGTCGTCTYPSGKHGYAVHLNGADCIQTVLMPSAAPATFTIMLWVNPSLVTVTPLLSRQTSSTSGNFPWLLATNDVNVTATMWDGSGNTTADGPLLTAGSWTHIAETYDGMSLVLYDGSTVSIKNATMPPAYGTRPDIFFGCEENGVGGTFNGDIDDVYIFDGALSEAQMAPYL